MHRVHAMDLINELLVPPPFILKRVHLCVPARKSDTHTHTHTRARIVSYRIVSYRTAGVSVAAPMVLMGFAKRLAIDMARLCACHSTLQADGCV